MAECHGMVPVPESHGLYFTGGGGIYDSVNQIGVGLQPLEEVPDERKAEGESRVAVGTALETQAPS